MKIMEFEPRALYIHCYGHSLNLATGDVITRSTLLQDALDTAHEVTKLIKCSPRRDNIFQNLKNTLSEKDSPGIRVLCSTRWTLFEQMLLLV